MLRAEGKTKLMKKILLACAVACCSSLNSFAGGILTNTNQNIAWNRMLCREASIGIDGVYSNPAGVAFMDKGVHLSINFQSVFQNRYVTSTFGGFAYNVDHLGVDTHKFKGEATAPIVPSVQFAWNTEKGWSFQLNAAVMGGGGKCEYDEGLGSFESVVSLIPMLASSYGITGYKYDSYLKGKQYYIGLQLGAGYTITENLSVYGGVRFLYGTCNYQGYLKNISVSTSSSEDVVLASSYFSSLYDQALSAATQYSEAAAQYEAAKEAATTDDEAALYAIAAVQCQNAAEQYQTAAATAAVMSGATQDISLDCDQTGFGVAPAIGIDYKLGKFNFAVKYDFRVKMNLENDAVNSASANNLSVLAKYKDGGNVREDQPALLAAGVQWEIIDPLRIGVGYHHFFDKKCTWYGDTQKKLDGDTNEFLAGAEYDITDWLQVSCGYQRTLYDFSDDFMNDISFSVSSYSLGGGFGITLSDHIKLNIAYFQTNYGSYKKHTDDYNNLGSMVSTLVGESTASALVESGSLKGSDKFTRDNKVFGIGIDFKF